jgi:hypothetical protein
MQPRLPATDRPSDGARASLARRLWPRWLVQAAADFILCYSLRDQIYLVVGRREIASLRSQ